MNGKCCLQECCGLDWNMVQAIDPILLYETQDYKVMQRFLSIFVKSQLGKGDQRFLSSPQSFRLALILQVILKYMLACQDQLKEKNEELEKRVSIQKQKINLLYEAQDNSRAILRDAYVDYEKCPICGKKYKNISYVDKHIQNHHKLHLMAWKSLRIDVPINPQSQVKELKKEISNLHKLMDEQTEKYAKTIVEFQSHIEELKADQNRQQNDHPEINFVEFNPSKTKKVELEIVPTKSSTVSRVERNAFNPHVVVVQHDFIDDDDDNQPKTLEERMERLRKKSKATANNISVGLGPNYLKKGQTTKILQFHNDTYEKLHREAEKELEDQFPLPGEKPPKKRYNSRISSTSGSTSVTNSSITSTNNLSNLASNTSTNSNNNINNNSNNNNNNNINNNNGNNTSGNTKVTPKIILESSTRPTNSLMLHQSSQNLSENDSSTQNIPNKEPVVIKTKATSNNKNIVPKQPKEKSSSNGDDELPIQNNDSDYNESIEYISDLEQLPEEKNLPPEKDHSDDYIESLSSEPLPQN